MKFKFNLILVFTLIFILGVFCVSSCKKANEEPVETTEEPIEATEEPAEDNGRPILELINDKVARETQFADPTANYSDIIRDGLAEKIREDLERMNDAFNSEDPNRMKEIVEVLHKIRRADTMAPITNLGQIVSYFAQLKNDLQVENFEFKFAGAVVVPVNIDKPVLDDEEPNFVSLNTYIFTFDLSSGSESADPGGSGDGEGIHRKVCTWEN